MSSVFVLQVDLTDVYFVSNHADGHGGALAAEGGTQLSTSGCMFFENSANGGGAVYAAGALTEVVLEQAVMHENKVLQEGGAMLLESESFSRVDGWVGICKATFAILVQR